MHAPQQVWLRPDALSRGLTDWVTFERRFQLLVAADQAELNLFASSRYRLSVNGCIVAHGPARFVPSYAEIASHDLRPFLRIGENAITVEACFIDHNTYQHVPDTTGRFIAWGSVAGVDLATPGDWRACRSGGCLAAVPAYSFAIGPVEIRDTRTSSPAWQPVAVLTDHIEGWRFLPDSVPPLSNKRLTPVMTALASLPRVERRIGLVSVHPTSRGAHDSPVRGQHFRYVTCLHSPHQQTITLGIHWGPHWFNGIKLEPIDDTTRGNRQSATVTLRSGWNLLCGEPEQLQPSYPLLIAFPTDAGITAHATPDLGEPAPIAFQPARKIDAADRWTLSAPSTFEQAGVNRDGWQYVGGDPAAPARMMAWDVLEECLPRPSLPHDNAVDFTAVFDLGTEYLAHVQIELDAAPGTIIDVGYDEKLRTDGALSWFSSNAFIESADRFICCGGRQTLETFHPRGGRYVQVTVRPLPGSRVTLHAVTLRDARSRQRLDRAFHSSRDVFDWTWNAGVATLQASADDVFCDSPWRERGMYLGDSYVQSMVELVASSEARIGARSLRLFSAAQSADGSFPNVAPSWYRAEISDFSLIYMLWLHDYWQHTRDTAILRDCLPAGLRMLKSPRWKVSSHSPLWTVPPGTKLFIDWGVHLPARQYDENGVLNAFRIRALDCAAVLLQASDEPAQSRQLLAQAEQLKAVYRDRLWLAQHGRFAGGTEQGRPVEREILHCNILALAFGLADPTHEPALADYVVRRLKGNAVRALGKPPVDDYAELYFLKYALDALVRINGHDVAQQVIADHMTPMRDAGSPTLWECLRWAPQGRGSRCHSWSAGPLVYLAKFANDAVSPLRHP